MAKQPRKTKQTHTPPYPIRQVSGIWYKMTPRGALEKPMTAAMRNARGVENDAD